MKKRIIRCILLMSSFGVCGSEIGIVSDRSGKQSQARSQSVIDRYVKAMRTRIEAIGVEVDTLQDSRLESRSLDRYRLLIFPYNPDIPSRVMDLVEEYVSKGGAIAAFYCSDNRLLKLIGIEGVKYLTRDDLPSLNAIRFNKKLLPGAPDLLKQTSWNIYLPRLGADGAKVVGTWIDTEGGDTGLPAATLHRNGFLFSHVLLNDDPQAAGTFLLALLGKYVDSIWENAFKNRISGVGTVGSLGSLGDLEHEIRLTGDRPEAVRALQTAKREYQRARALSNDGRYREAYKKADAAESAALDAFLLSRRSRIGELRGAWIHSAYGIGEWGWDKTIKVLAENGFNAIFPNMLWAGSADFPSNVLPVHPLVAKKGDQIELCLQACRKYGLEMHVWKVNWNLGHHTPNDVKKWFRRAGRLQADYEGKSLDYLAPHLEENFKLERNSMLEVVRKYDVDGIHFDYIRYPGSKGDFSDSARSAFETWLGKRVPDWPSDCRNGNELMDRYNQWRRENITRLVKDVYGAAHKIKPGISVSAAVFPEWSTAPTSIAQDTRKWIENGWLDFVCPMNYNESNDWLKRVLEYQITAVRGKIPLYCGLGAWKHDSPALTSEQIEISRRLGADGFICFSHNATFANRFLPALGKGVARTKAGILPHQSLKTEFFLPPSINALENSYRLGDRLTVKAIVRDPGRDFRPHVTITRDGYTERPAPAPRVRPGKGSVTCTFVTREAGRYRIRLNTPPSQAASLPPLMARSPVLHVLTNDQISKALSKHQTPEFTGARQVNAAIWDENAYGAAALIKLLSKEDWLELIPIGNLEMETLMACDVVILPQPRDRERIFRQQQTMKTVGDYIRRGGGVLLTHALVGVRGYLPPVPEVATGGEVLEGNDWRPKGRHPVIEGVDRKLHQSTFPDRVYAKPGENGKTVAVTSGGLPVVVAGQAGRGRCVACGLGIGIGPDDKNVEPSDAEYTLVLNSIRWLAAEKSARPPPTQPLPTLRKLWNWAKNLVH